MRIRAVTVGLFLPNNREPLAAFSKLTAPGRHSKFSTESRIFICCCLSKLLLRSRELYVVTDTGRLHYGKSAPYATHIQVHALTTPATFEVAVLCAGPLGVHKAITGEAEEQHRQIEGSGTARHWVRDHGIDTSSLVGA